MKHPLSRVFLSLASTALACLAALLLCNGLRAEDKPRTPPPPPAESHQFDFWIGEWEVTLPNGRIAGHNRIESILDGRALQEHWVGTGGGAGTSLNVYDSTARKWRQFWTDRSGGVLQLAGEFREGKMILQSENRGASGTEIDRITWTPNSDATVRQLWEKSTDGGATWQVAFDGLYHKR